MKSISEINSGGGNLFLDIGIQSETFRGILAFLGAFFIIIFVGAI